MKNSIVKSFTLLAFAFLVSTIANAQAVMPVPSPAASVSQQVGFTKISIEYSSPGVKGRTIFGDLLPWGVTWRAGANAATKITFSTSVKLGGKDLRGGTYTLFVTPMEKGDWMVHLNKEQKSVYAYMKDGKIDEEALAADAAVSFKAKAMEAPKKAERLNYWITANDNKVGAVGMVWENSMIEFEVDTKAEGMLESIKKSMN